MHRFELRDALLIYRENRRSFITWHAVTAQKDGPPLLGPAQPLTTPFVEDLTVSLSGGLAAEVLPENVLAKTDRMITWWTPPRVHRMFFENVEGKAQQLNGKLFPQPPLVWRVAAHEELRIRALCENKRPKAQTTLAVAPFWNLSDDAGVCLGSMRCPESASVGSIDAWERGFYESAFTHANVGRLTRHEGGHDALWAKLAGRRRPFPMDSLIRLPQTLAQFVQGR
jgi:PRTRC genetic system protein B